MPENMIIISGKEAAEMLGVHPSYLYKLMRQGRLHRVQKGRTIKTRLPLYFQRSEVEKLLDASDEKPEQGNCLAYASRGLMSA